VPRITVLLQSLDHVISYQVAFVFAEPLPKPPNELARPHERERDGKPEHVAAGLHS
jgi:hypothetical protein